ncbi:MAG: leucine--tRNA ligase [Candidatus Magasanikbacteria bacterium]|jgi:leucyl-tRNA synthetase|nr:leucine--tRNA ligase [Candidatus Magasanikbacteria bacterium]MBT4314773.1 leucine--tRNA ligase [Candidatus Magasanikbacteria bacterium]MBT4547550.1 leucine--tRNA ligase [Candidatus Magasanikbacteria bacterium]MBT6819384.1 leucine--tRNA ligase [Candidatus Magasanikbacteria bacterium]
MKTYKEFLENKGEAKWQKYWEKKKLFKTPEEVTKTNKYYILPQLPYPSGSGLHVGHAEVYSACDIYARYQRMKGKKVLQAIGWDSFGLPAENYAIKNNVHPKISTDKAIDNFREQIKSLGISVDWDKEVGAHNSDYYKWTQWFFLLFYKRGLVYRKKQAVNWCKSCKTVLANDQVTSEGYCERCDTQIIQKDMEQWYIKVTEYADRLLEGLDKIDWPEETKKRQRDWIGRSEGASVEFKILNSEFKIEVFTTRPDTLFGATYIVLAPEGQYVQDLKDRIQNWDEVKKYIEATSKKTELARQIDKEKIGVELKGVKAINPANNEEIPIYIADFVLASYGTGAVFADAHDERDFEFAKKYNIPLLVTIKPDDENEWKKVQNLEVCYEGDGVHFNSGFLDGLRINEAKTKIIKWLEEKNIGKGKVQYKLRDWSVSRQRFWGAPIPMLQNEEGEMKPVPEEDLPILLPEDVDFKPTGESPLNYSKEFQERAEKKYGKGWKYEPDTLDTFMCSSWYFFRYLDPKNDSAFASPEALKKWMPVDFYLGGPEHVNGHLLYSRFFTKVLFDAGYIDFDEPFKVHRHQGLILGPDNRKMSKRWGNTINPTDVVNQYGADTMRMYEMFIGPLEDDKPWNENGVKGVRRFLDKVWKLQEKVGDEKKEDERIEKLTHKVIKKASEDLETLGFNTAIAEMMKIVNEMNKEESLQLATYSLLLRLLTPFAPHMAEELWSILGHKDSICIQSWPEYDENLVKDDELTIVVQINGKLRGDMTVSADISEDDAKKQALEIENVVKWLEGKEPKKVIYVKGKLVSIVV